MKTYIVTWMDDDCTIISENFVYAEDLPDALRQVTDASHLSDVTGATQCSIMLPEEETQVAV